MRKLFSCSSVAWVLAAAVLVACGGGGGPTPDDPIPDDPDPVAAEVTGFEPTTVWARVPTPFVVTGTDFEKLEGAVRVAFTTPSASLDVPGTLGSDGRITGMTPAMAVDEVTDAEVVVTIGTASLAWEGRLTCRPPQVDDGWPTPIPAGLGAQPLLIRGGGFGVPDEPASVRIVADAGYPFSRGKWSEMAVDGYVTAPGRVRCRCPAALVGSRVPAGVGLSVAGAMEVVSPWGVLTFDPERKLTRNDGEAEDHFGYSVALSGDTAVVGAYSGSAYVFVRSGTTWTEQDKLTPDDGEAGDLFGYSVALSGDTAVVGAEDDDNGANSGSAYVWIDLPAKLTEASAADGAGYGKATALYGEWTIAGAPGAGRAHLRRDQDGAWVPAPPLVPPGDGTAADYGASVALNGHLAVVGAPHDDEGGAAAGAVYVYLRPTGEGNPAWPELTKLVGQATGEDFGRAVAVYRVRTPGGKNDYDLVVVGAPLADVNGNEDAGAVYVFKHREGSVTELTKLTADRPAATDEFGNAVAVYGERIAVGAWRDDGPTGGPDTGAVYVFTGSEATWELEKWLPASDPETKDHLGISVALSGSTLVAGAFGESSKGAKAGAAYVFERVEVASRFVWRQRAKLVAPDGEANARFGRSVAVLGNVIAMGAPYQDDGVQGVDNTGAVYLFRRCGETWAHDHTWTAWDGDALDTFGYGVALGSEHVVASAPWDDDEAPDAGAVYVHLLR